ncbi:MAG: hypothetical protein PVG39_13905, partial [Desulfobacteraceae bacterium]
MKRINLYAFLISIIISFFLITGSAFAGDNIFPTNGNVGIGTTSPDALLEINGANDYKIRLNEGIYHTD